jgi:crossover junction endodeoxyribonuclease RuvC
MFAPTGSSAGHRVLGIDPGLTRCGYAVLESTKTAIPKVVSMGLLRTSPTAELPERLAALLDDVQELLNEFTPQAVAVEQVFFQVNVRTAMSVGQASGLVLALAYRAGCQVVQYPPNQVKEAVTGSGRADKAQVQRMVQMRLGLTVAPDPPDVADAAAVALCHLAVEPVHRQLIAAGASSVTGRLRSRKGS